MTIREGIFAEIERRLLAIDDPAVAEVERMPSGDPISFPALGIYDDGQQLEDDDVVAARYSMGAMIEGFIEAADGPEAHAAMNDLYAAVVRALMLDGTLGGLVETITEGAMRVSVAELASKRRLGFSLDLDFTFSTRRDDPALLA